MPNFMNDLNCTEELKLTDAQKALALATEQIIHLSSDPNATDTHRLVGVEDIVRRILVCVIIGGNVLLEGNPGLAKTKICRAVAQALCMQFRRTQFTPDMQPSDLISKQVMKFDRRKTYIEEVRGPIFCNFLLADEINRASPKVQSALLEAMEERRVTPLGEAEQPVRPVDESGILKGYGPFFKEERINPDTRNGLVFSVVATQNPIEQEGTYPLAEASTDRFTMKLIFDYPEHDKYKELADHAFWEEKRKGWQYDKEDHAKSLYFFTKLRKLLLGEAARKAWTSEGNELRERVEALIHFTHACMVKNSDERRVTLQGRHGMTPAQERCEIIRRNWQKNGSLDQKTWANKLGALLRDKDYPEVETGASPRGLLRLIQAIHAHALFENKFSCGGKLNPDWNDVKAVAPDVLRHRIRLSIGSSTLGSSPDDVVDALLNVFAPEY